MIAQTTLEFRTRGRGTTDIGAEIQRAVAASGIRKGVCTVFLQHTSASLMLCGNVTAKDTGAILARAIDRIRRISSANPGPFTYHIGKSGKPVRMD